MSKARNSTAILPGHTNDQRIRFHAPKGYMQRAQEHPAFRLTLHTHAEDRNNAQVDLFPCEDVIAARARAVFLEKYADLIAATASGGLGEVDEDWEED
jgi:hypothetical protein